MRILHLSKYYHPYRGGIEKVIKELAESALEQGHDVTVICSSENSQKKVEMVNGVRVIRLPQWGTMFSQPLTPSVFWGVQTEFHRADVVHLHAPNPLFEFACLSFKFKAPLVVTYHCEVVKSRWLNRFYEPVSKAILQRADRILVATPLHIQHSFWLKEFSHKCEVIPFGIEPKYEKKSLELNNHLHSIKNQYGRYFLFIGRMVPYKGVNILLEAMQSVPQNLLLIGKGPYLERWKAMSRQLEVADRVHFLGPVNADDEFGAFLHGADAVVLPSISEAEAFGLVLLEGMSCRKPAITTDLNSGVRFVNIGGQTGLEVPRGDVSALASAMNELRVNEELRDRLGEQAFTHFQQNFLISQSLQKHLDVYLKLNREAVA